MPTHEERPEFRRDFEALTREQQLAFLAVLRRFIADLRRGQFRAGVRVKRVQGYPGVWEMTWAPDGRAIRIVYEGAVRCCTTSPPPSLSTRCPK